MAHKMKGFPMQDTSSTHGTNANYKKSGAPGLLGNIMDPLGLFGKAKGLLGGKGKPCPPAPPAQQAAAPAPDAPAQPAAPAPAAAAPVVDPNAGVSDQGEAPVPMKRNLKVGAPKMDSPMQKGETSWKNKAKSAWYTMMHHDGGKSSTAEQWKTYKDKKKEFRGAKKTGKDVSWKSGY